MEKRMDADIVARLHAAAKGASDSLPLEAADEIERLRVALYQVAFKALDEVSETAIYKVRKKYITQAMQQAKAKAKAKLKQPGQASKEWADGKKNLSDRYIKLLLSKHGNVRFKDITPDVIQLKRDQIIAKRLEKQLLYAAETQQRNDYESIQ